MKRMVMMAIGRRHRGTKKCNVFTMNGTPHTAWWDRGSLGTLGTELGIRRGEKLPEKRRDGTTRERTGSRGAEGQVGGLGEGCGIVTSESGVLGIVFAQVEDATVRKNDPGKSRHVSRGERRRARLRGGRRARPREHTEDALRWTVLLAVVAAWGERLRVASSAKRKVVGAMLFASSKPRRGLRDGGDDRRCLGSRPRTR